MRKREETVAKKNKRKIGNSKNHMALERELYFNEINNNKININNKIAINLKMEKFRFYIVIFFVVFKFKETKDMKININES